MKQILIGLACAALLSSCFIPDQHEAEVRLSKEGSWPDGFFVPAELRLLHS